MLKHLHVQNIILVESASVPFEAGLNILSGETGSGKSALMHGIALALGERADTSLIRKGCDRGVVEASFEIDELGFSDLLQQGGIDHDFGSPLIVRREVAANGKGRIFVNNQQCQLAFLRQLGNRLVQVVGQHANVSLCSLDYHQEVIDLFGDLDDLASRFQKSYEKEKSLSKELQKLINEEGQRLRETDNCQREIEEIEEAALKEGEEEELFTEFVRLNNAEEISKRLGEINQALFGERAPLVATLHRQEKTLETLLHYDPSLQETHQCLKEVCLELQEIGHTLRQAQGRASSDPHRLQEVDERLSLINKLKRKYGGSPAEIASHLLAVKERLRLLDNLETAIEETQKRLDEATQECHALAKELGVKRRAAAAAFSRQMTEEVRTLNMPKAEFFVEVTEQNRTQKGDDRVEFFLSPNVGESRIALREGASGGELSRVLLALQTLMAGKENKATLVFDEVDANIGGETATIVGDKLRGISKKHQVICITHFPQVATQADHHLQISKHEKEGRTLTVVMPLNKGERKKELSRMAGMVR